MKIAVGSVKRSWALIGLAMVSAVFAVQAATDSLAPLVDSVLRNGPDGELPAHLSVVLGVSPLQQKTPVKQAVIRQDTVVRTFNVCTGNRGDLVILTYNEQSRRTKAYLLSTTGVLRKAVYYQAGGVPTERSLEEARSDFDREVEFWTAFSERSK